MSCTRRCRFCYIEFGFWSLVVIAIVLLFVTGMLGCQSSAAVEPGRSSAKATSDERRPVVTETWKVTVPPPALLNLPASPPPARAKEKPCTR